ncbi:hypothetical protein ANO11243_027160 [Dothideomycetidae sp. 11243]|nr:hypothetical protein ANO11243_027160 [fungal sp. No.11243]
MSGGPVGLDSNLQSVGPDPSRTNTNGSLILEDETIESFDKTSLRPE